MWERFWEFRVQECCTVRGRMELERKVECVERFWELRVQECCTVRGRMELERKVECVEMLWEFKSTRVLYCKRKDGT